MVKKLGFRVPGAGFRFQGSGFKVQGSGSRVQGAGCSGQGSRCRVEVLGSRDSGSGLCWSRARSSRHL